MEATFLTEDQIFGNNALDVIKAYGTEVGFSDLAVLQGGLMASSHTNIEGKRTGAVWSASPHEVDFVRCVGIIGGEFWHSPV